MMSVDHRWCWCDVHVHWHCRRDHDQCWRDVHVRRRCLAAISSGAGAQYSPKGVGAAITASSGTDRPPAQALCEVTIRTWTLDQCATRRRKSQSRLLPCVSKQTETSRPRSRSLGNNRVYQGNQRQNSLERHAHGCLADRHISTITETNSLDFHVHGRWLFHHRHICCDHCRSW